MLLRRLPIRPQLPQLLIALFERFKLRLIFLLHAICEPIGESLEMARVREFLFLFAGVGYADQEHDVGLQSPHQLHEFLLVL